MTTSLYADAFEHHVWATDRIIEACETLSEAQLAEPVPGTYGSIIDTLRHTVGADCWYLLRLGGEHDALDEATADLAALRTQMNRHGDLWRGVLARDIDPDELVVVERDDGSVARSATGLRLAQAVHHGTDHRSQVCTALTQLGIEPPEVDAWAYGFAHGRFEDTAAD